MKPLLTWLAIAATAFGALAGGNHWYLESHPRRLLVVVDSSFAMREAWPRLPELLKSLEGRPYTRYALETEKSPVHGYAASLDAGRIGAYAPRDFTALAQRAAGGAFAEADEVILVSNAGTDELKVLPGWRVVRP